MNLTSRILLGAFLLPSLAAAPAPADRPVPRSDANSQRAHEQLLTKARSGRIDVYFEGDSITRRWGATDYPELLAHWKTSFHGWNAANFGWGSDRVENILWRLENGELEGVHPKVIVLLAGTNNAPGTPAAPEELADHVRNITRGLEAVVRVMRTQAPDAVILVMGLFPRQDSAAAMTVLQGVNRNLERLADGRKVRYLDLTPRWVNADGTLRPGLLDPDGVHLTLQGYDVWADGLKPVLTELLGPPAAEDHAPAPTGNPGASPAAPSKAPAGAGR